MRSRPERILVRVPNWVGDSVLSIPALKALRERFPDAEITLWARPSVAGLFASAGFADAVEIHPRRSLAGLWRAARELRERPHDLGLLLPNSFESALSMFAAGATERAGYRTDRRGLLLTRGVPLPDRKMHQADYYLHLVESLFGSGPAPAPDLQASPEQLSSARRLLAGTGVDAGSGYAVLCPGAAFGAAKRWHPDRFAGLGDRLARTGKPVVVVGSSSERPLGSDVARLMEEPAAVLSGQTDLETLMGLLAAASVVISNDSGPMHIAAALGTPTLAVFGATDPDRTRPLGRCTHVLYHPVPCGPCLLKECPIDHRCMDAVSVDEAFDAARSLAPLTPVGSPAPGHSHE